MNWLNLLSATEFLRDEQFTGINADAVESIKLIANLAKTAKVNLDKE